MKYRKKFNNVLINAYQLVAFVDPGIIINVVYVKRMQIDKYIMIGVDVKQVTILVKLKIISV